MPMSLAIADCQMDLHVISFTGQDALNEVYRFDIDLISRDPDLDFASLLNRDAFLSFGTLQEGVHGQIGHASRKYAGISLSHYRISLMPRLQTLGKCRQRRVHHDVNVPRLIARLLEEHGIGKDAYRFEQTIGLYPKRDMCVQYDESDLHLLQRLCEEEGIHFRFEHSPSRHLLVFSDDSASFPEQRMPVHFKAVDSLEPAIHYLGECLSIHPGYSSQIHRRESATTLDLSSADEGQNDHGSHQVFDKAATSRPHTHEEAFHRQRSTRRLERLRCERRKTLGNSNQPAFCSGRIIQVLDHPESSFNDQWLLTQVQHAGRQPHLLEGFDPHEIATIMSGLKPVPAKTWPEVSGLEAFDHGYRNAFGVIAWSMAFRPALKRTRPLVSGYHSATLMEHPRTDEQGRRPIRLDWQKVPTSSPFTQRWPLARIARTDEADLHEARAGTRVVVSHLDGDPDRPVICGLLQADDMDSDTRIHLDGTPWPHDSGRIHLGTGQQLRIDTRQDLTLHGEQGALQITGQAIAITGPQAMKASSSFQRDSPPPAIPDLRLTQKPGLQGAPLAHRTWYIVRMLQPGLETLARLETKHFLYEGKTDAQGYLGLSQEQLQQLAAHYNKTPHTLCLIHPGKCITLMEYFQQNWTEQQRQAFILNGL
ncbi:type VI secretion system tip protein TssI/VgrG [Pseudomonas sp. NPDC089734]|uniref:type VI secretion system tip protein TssI/VgrG n=1 Tax=Pseudomonas sp. NPDC089734 TaxID=3364469 RepID=UPI00381A0BAD